MNPAGIIPKPLQIRRSPGYAGAGVFSCILFFAWLMQSSTANAQEPAPEAGQYGRVVISTEPDTAWVYLDGRARGYTPLLLDSLSPGMHRIRLVDLNVSSWFSHARVDSFLSEPGVERTLHFSLPRRYALVTSPSGAEVFRGDTLLGTTPLVVPEHTGGGTEVLLRREGYADTSLSLPPRGSRILILSLRPLGDSPLPPSPFSERSETAGGRRIILAGMGAVVAGAGAAYFKLAADEKNAEYNRTGDPAVQAQRNSLDAAAAACLIATQIAVGFLIAFLLAE